MNNERETQDAEYDALNTQYLPCDVKIGNTTFTQGVPLWALVVHARSLRLWCDEEHHDAMKWRNSGLDPNRKK